jgi:hypothetical protein
LRVNGSKWQPTEEILWPGIGFSTLTVNHERRCLVWHVMGGLCMCRRRARGVANWTERLPRLCHFSSDCWPTSSCGVLSARLPPSLFYLLLPGYLQSLSSTRLSFPSALSLQHILFVALPNALLVHFLLSLPQYTARQKFYSNVFSWRFPCFRFVLGIGCLR